jgi:hypothetical protein
MLNKTACYCVLIFALLFLSGCGGTKKPDGLPNLHPCRITVTMNGSALEGASVTLSGSDGRWSGNGRTDVNGAAVIVTRGQFQGVAEGEYKVTVSKIVPPTSRGKDEGSNEEPKTLVNTKYASPATTPLTCTVKPGTNQFEFSVDAP